ncbi:hypothetical protein ACFXAE_14045 [Streptomyces sp. NPDC059454]|uniref:hypothetical protein n=1 Tax=Streptomyces sp. NPDC059454 TaxID=3346836 RepID=UPI0036ADC96D
MEKWREDAQPEWPEGVSAFEKGAEDEDLRETRVLPLSEKPAGADVRGADSGPGFLEDRWARIGVFPGDNDRTRVLPDAAHRAEPPARPEPRDGDARGPAAPGRTTPSGSPADAPWDTERTAALRIPRRPGDVPGATTAGPSSRPGGVRPSGDFGATGSPSASGRPQSDPGTAVFPPTSGRPSSGPGAAGAPTGFRGSSVDSGAPTGFRGSSVDSGVPTGFRGSSADSGAPTQFLRPSADSGTPTVSRTPLRDPWQEEAGDSAAATHDPHEVTVQLDSVQIGEGLELRRATGRVSGGQDAAGGPVFVDESGRRSRLYRRIGLAVGLACAGYAVVMVATLLSGNSDAPWMPVPGQEDKPAGQVGTTPRPEETGATPGTGTGPAPGGTPTTGTPTLPAPGATAPATGGGAGTADQPDTAAPTSTATRQNTTDPATGGDGDATSTPPDDTVSTAPADPPVSEIPDPVTTAPTGGGEAGGTDNAAGAPADRPVVAADGSAAQPDRSTTPTAPSPENVL